MQFKKWILASLLLVNFAAPQLAFAAPTEVSTAEQIKMATLQEKTLVLREAAVRPTIVVFWASLGFGHLSAARAIKNDVETAYPNANVVLKDVREFQPEWRQKVVGSFYDFLTKQYPKSYDWWYQRYMQEGATIDSPGNLPLAEKHRPKEILAFLKENKATMVISAFNHATEALIRLRDQGELKNVPIAQVLTDYVPTEYFRRMGERVEMTFVPHKGIEEAFLKAGLPADKVRTSGIPVGQSIFLKITPEEMNSFMAEKGLDPKLPTVLLVSGSAGVGDFPLIVKSIADQYKDSPVQIVAVTAKNKGHFKDLNKLTLPVNIKLKVLGLVPNDELIKYMKASNVMVTKTGGLTASEVIALGKPTVFLDINGGQESYNSNFMKQTGMGYATDNQNEVGRMVKEILSNTEIQQKMLRAQALSQTTMDRTAVLDWTIDTYYKAAVNLPKMPSSKPSKAYFMTDKHEVAQARWDLLGKETKEVFAAYLLFDGNKVGRAALAGAREARRRGAKVRLIVDGWNMASWVDEVIDKATMAALMKEGVEIRQFNPVDLSTKMTYLNPENFKRMHDKLLYLGSQEVLFTGDRNTQNVNFGLQKSNGQSGKSYVSIETMVQGSAVEGAKAHLERTWELAKVPDVSMITEAQIAAAARKLDRMATMMAHLDLPQIDWKAKMTPVESVNFVSDMPGKKGVEFPVDAEILRALGSAKQKITILSPYIHLPKPMLEAVKAARTRGVEVTVYTTSREGTDAKIASLAFILQAKELKDMGASVQQFNGKNFLHAKGLRVDNDYSFVTGHNFNDRSSYTDQESGVAIKDKAYAAEFDKFLGSLKDNMGPIDLTPPSELPMKCKMAAIKYLIKIPVLGRQL